MFDRLPFAIMWTRVAFIFIAGVFNILSLATTQEFNISMLILFIFYIPFLLDVIDKRMLNETATKVRRYGYIILTVVIVLLILILILHSFFEIGSFILHNWIAYILIYISFLAMFVLQFFFSYNSTFNKEELEAMEHTNEFMINSRKKKQENYEEQKENMKKKHRSHSRRKGNEKLPKKDKIQGGGL